MMPTSPRTGCLFRTHWMWVVLLLAGGCNAALTSFDVPAATWAGHEFVIAVTGTGGPGNNNPNGDYVGCVLQVPNGFTVTARGPGLPDEASLLQVYTAEPGHYLVSQSGFANTQTASTHFVVRAPLTAGQYTFKTALGGYAMTSSYHAVDPQNVTSFAQITAAPYVRTTTVAATTTDWFAVAAAGLPALQGRRPEFADVNHDGLADVISGPGPEVFLALPGGGFVNRSPAPVPSPLDAVAIGDFDGDGHLDFVHATRDVYFGDGTGNWTRVTLGPPTFGNVQTLTAGDFDRDGRSDIAECDSNGWVRCFRAEPGRTFRSLSYGLPGGGTVQAQLAFADVSGDGWPDLVCTSGMWLSSGIGTWQAVPNLAFGTRFALGDLIGDPRPEILTLNGGANGPLMVYTTSNGTTWGGSQIGVPNGNNLAFANVVAIGDLDADGTQELLLARTGPEAWRLVSGLLTPVPGSGLPARLGSSSNESPAVGHLLLTDVDGDGRSEVVAGPVRPGDWQPLLWQNLTTGLYPYGAGCSGGSYAAPALSAIGQPSRGNSAFGLAIGGGVPQGLTALWLGLSRQLRFGSTPLPLPLGGLGAPGCSLLAEDLAVHVLVASGAGTAGLPFPIPANPGLRYVSLYAQGAVLAPGANTLGALTTQGLGIRID